MLYVFFVLLDFIFLANKKWDFRFYILKFAGRIFNFDPLQPVFAYLYPPENSRKP